MTESAAPAVTNEHSNEEKDDKVSEIAPTTATAEKSATETTTPCHEEHHHPEEATVAPKIDLTSTEVSIPMVKKVEVPPPVVPAVDTIADKDEVIPDVRMNQENRDSAADEG